MVANDLNTYKPAVERLGDGHQICTAHVKKWARNRLDKIEGWDWFEAKIWRMLTEPPFNGDLEILRVERAGRDGDAILRCICVDLSACPSGY